MKPLITDIPLKDLSSIVAGLGLKKYAVHQIISWLYKERVDSFDLMTNLSKKARENLADLYDINAIEVSGLLESKDGTKKYLCKTRDGHGIECVFIPSEDGRNTVCISTQVGCAMGCMFCRTAKMGFVRDLTQGEILGELIVIDKDNAGRLTNVVLMGMGEPLANIDEVSNAVEVMLDSRVFGLSKRRVTISTCGYLPGLEKFVERFDIKIAISLNATDDETRSRLMPINNKFKINDIIAFCRKYSMCSRYRVTFEYALIRGVNDRDEDLARLIQLLKDVKAKVNLIPFNPFKGLLFLASEEKTISRWQDELAKSGIQTNVRVSRGQDILAACGQLAS